MWYTWKIRKQILREETAKGDLDIDGRIVLNLSGIRYE
jgi:hypothetical protein